MSSTHTLASCGSVSLFWAIVSPQPSVQEAGVGSGVMRGKLWLGVHTRPSGRWRQGEQGPVCPVRRWAEKEQACPGPLWQRGLFLLPDLAVGTLERREGNSLTRA